MSKKLFFEALAKFFLGVILVGGLVFLPAGTLKYVNGWIFMGVLFIPMFIAGLVMMAKNPELLISRLDAKEKEKEQSLVVKLSGLMFIGGFVLAGLDYRFNWLNFPEVLTYIGIFFFLLAYLLYAEVLKENETLKARVSELENIQVVANAGVDSKFQKFVLIALQSH